MTARGPIVTPYSAFLEWSPTSAWSDAVRIGAHVLLVAVGLATAWSHARGDGNRREVIAWLCWTGGVSGLAVDLAVQVQETPRLLLLSAACLSIGVAAVLLVVEYRS